jgi:hypothetical protein
MGAMKGALAICAVGVAIFGSCAGPRREASLPKPNLQGRPGCDEARGMPVFPESPQICAATDDSADTGPQTCVPAGARGPEIAHDQSLGVRIFRACEAAADGEQPGAGHLDRHRLIIERTGIRSASREELHQIALLEPKKLAMSDGDIRRFTVGLCPETGGLDADAETPCLDVGLGTEEVDLPELMRAFASLYAGYPRCASPWSSRLEFPNGVL